MRAVSLDQCGGPEVLVVSDVPVPSLKEGEVLIKAVSAGVNPVDLLVATGAYLPAKFPKVRSQPIRSRFISRNAACIGFRSLLAASLLAASPPAPLEVAAGGC